MGKALDAWREQTGKTKPQGMKAPTNAAEAERIAMRNYGAVTNPILSALSISPAPVSVKPVYDKSADRRREEDKPQNRIKPDELTQGNAEMLYNIAHNAYVDYLKQPEPLTSGNVEMIRNMQQGFVNDSRIAVEQALANQDQAALDKAKAEYDAASAALKQTQDAQWEQNRQNRIAAFESGKATGANDKGGALRDWNNENIMNALRDPTNYGGLMLSGFSSFWDNMPIIIAYMTPEERATALRLGESGDTEGMREYIDLVSRDANKRRADWFTESVYQGTKDAPAGAIVARSIAGMANLGGLAAPIKQTIKNATTGEDAPIDYNDWGYSFSQLRDATARGLTDDIKSPVGQFAAQTGLSLADFLAQSLTGPVAPVMMAGNAASDKSYELAQRGVSAEKTLALSALSGAIEAVTEKIGLDNMMKLLKGGGKPVAQFVKGIAMQAGIEAGEETIAEYANTLAENAILGDESAMRQYADQMMAQGMSKEEAEKKAFSEYFLKNPALAALGGAISGGIVGGGAQFAGGGISPSNSTQNPTATITDEAADSRPGAPGLAVDAKENAALKKAAADQSEIDKYVDYAISKSRFVDNPLITSEVVDDLNLGEVSPAFAAEIAAEYGVDINGYTHVLTDNDIRHIFNRHGPHTREALPVTADDIKSIPQIINSADAVYYVPRADGKAGIVYHYRHNGVTYYLEQIVDAEQKLRNKQMIKVPTGTVPDIPGLKAAIAAKSTGALPGDAANAVPQMYVQDVKPDASNTTIQQNEPAVNPEERSVGPNTVGAMQSAFPYVEAVSQQNSLQAPLTEAERQMDEFNPDNYTHEVVTNEARRAVAEQRLQIDREGEAEYLRGKETWDASDVTTAHVLYEQMIAEARKTGDYKQAAEWYKLIQAQASEEGRALQANEQFARTPENIIGEAAVTLEQAAKENPKAAKRMPANTLDTISNLAYRYDAAVQDGDLYSLADIIRETSKIRRTGTFLQNKLSRQMEWALERVMENGDADFMNDLAFAGISAISGDYLGSSAADKVLTVRRLSMLSKITTVMRNIVSNNVFDPTDSFARNISVPLDIWLSKRTGTRSIATDRSWLSPEKRKGTVDGWAKSVLEVGLDLNATGDRGRYESGSNRTFKMQGSLMSRLMSTWEKYSGYALVSTDAAQKGGIRAEIGRGTQQLAEEGKLKQPAADQSRLANETADKLTTPMKPGTVVRALDRGNYGKVVSHNPTDNSYAVHFVSREGYEATKQFPADALLPTTYTETPSAAEQAAEERRLSPEQLAEQLANDAALYRTFQDETPLSKAVIGVRSGMNQVKIGGEDGVGLGDLTIPFAQVPANLASRAAEYSPYGLIKSGAQLATALIRGENGNLTAQEQAKIVQGVGRGLTGTSVTALAAVAALKGIIRVLDTGRDEDDKDKTAFQKMAGEYATQINLSAFARMFTGESTDWQDGDKIINLDFLEPLNALLTTGALVAEDAQSDGKLTAKEIASSTIAGLIQSVLDLPVMETWQNLSNNLQAAASDTEGGRWGEAAADFAADTLASFIPNILAGIAQGTDNKQRDQYTGETFFEQLADALLAKIPGARQTLPAKLDSWGEEMDSGNGFLNFLNTNILPGYVRQYESTPLNDEVSRLAEETGISTYPTSKAPNKVSDGGVDYKLDSDEKRSYQQTYGQNAKAYAQGLMDWEGYEELPDSVKAEVLLDLYELAAVQAKQEILDGRGADFAPSKAEQTLLDMEEGARNTYLAYKAAFEAAQKGDEEAYTDMMGEFKTLDKNVQEMLSDINMWEKTYAAVQAGYTVEEFEQVRAYKNSADDDKGEAKEKALAAGMDAETFNKLYAIMTGK